MSLQDIYKQNTKRAVRLSASAKWLLHLLQEADKRDWIWVNFPFARNQALDSYQQDWGSFF